MFAYYKARHPDAIVALRVVIMTVRRQYITRTGCTNHARRKETSNNTTPPTPAPAEECSASVVVRKPWHAREMRERHARGCNRQRDLMRRMLVLDRREQTPCAPSGGRAGRSWSWVRCREHMHEWLAHTHVIARTAPADKNQAAATNQSRPRKDSWKGTLLLTRTAGGHACPSAAATASP